MKNLKFLVVLLSISILANFSMAAGKGNPDKERGAKGQGHSVMICHRTQGTNEEFELWVPESAVEAHLEHGDDVWFCAGGPLP